MKLTWEFCGGLLTGLGAAAMAVGKCGTVRDVSLPGGGFVGGVMLILLGVGIARGAQELRCKEESRATEAEKARC